VIDLSIKEQLAADLKAAMKEKNTIKKDTVQMVRAAVLQKEKDGKLVLDDDGVVEVIAKEVKSRKDVLPDYEKSGRDDLIAKINEEIAILLDYLPEQLSEDELRSIVKDAITETGASSMTDMGKIMAVVMPKIKGKADGKAVNALVRELMK
jgi:uncharacterized protein YqeY